MHMYHRTAWEDSHSGSALEVRVGSQSPIYGFCPPKKWLERLGPVFHGEGATYSNWVQKGLDDFECPGESPWSINEVKSTQSLRIVVLGNCGSRLDVIIDRGDACDSNPLEVHYGATGLKEFLRFPGASGQTRIR